MFSYCLIMAGGFGTRLWPMSTSKLPKQFLPAVNGKSFFFLALERALILGEKIIIIAGKKYIPDIINDASKLTTAEKKRLIVIGEPAAKNTAAAIACAVAFAKSQNAVNMIALTSDHIIEPAEIFKSDAESAAKEAAENNLVIFGIPPSRPETEYGYIETKKLKNKCVYEVAAFHEKPKLINAKNYIKSKRFFWNSGMFVFNTGFMEDQFKSLTPEIYKYFEKLKAPEKEEYSVLKGIKILSGWSGLENAYKKCSNISFDYAVTEKCKKIAMFRANFNWIDIGSWDEYIKICTQNNSQVFTASSNNCYVDSDIPAALAGVDDLVVIIRTGKNGGVPSAFIAKKGKTGLVKDIVKEIKIAGRTDLL